MRKLKRRRWTLGTGKNQPQALRLLDRRQQGVNVEVAENGLQELKPEAAANDRRGGQGLPS